MNTYREDLAYIHDAGFGDFARQTAPELLTLLHRYDLTGGCVVDLGCGSGIWAKALHEAGYDVLGIDLSSAMIALARARVPAATFQAASFLDAELPPCVAVTSLGESLGYLLDERNHPDRLRVLFERIYAALQPGGLLLFDLLTPGCVHGVNPQRRWRTGPDWAVLTEVEEHPDATLTRRIIAFREVGGVYRRSEEVHRVYLYDAAVLAGMLREVGFRVRLRRGYGAFHFDRPGHRAFIARKPC